MSSCTRRWGCTWLFKTAGLPAGRRAAQERRGCPRNATAPDRCLIRAECYIRATVRERAPLLPEPQARDLPAFPPRRFESYPSRVTVLEPWTFPPSPPCDARITAVP